MRLPYHWPRRAGWSACGSRRSPRSRKDCAERTGQESDTECGESGEEGCDFVTIRKEYAGDSRSKKAVDDEVVPFERVAEHGRGNDTTQLTALCCRPLDSQGHAPCHCFHLENNARYGRIDAQNLCIIWPAARRLRTGGVLGRPSHGTTCILRGCPWSPEAAGDSAPVIPIARHLNDRT